MFPIKSNLEASNIEQVSDNNEDLIEEIEEPTIEPSTEPVIEVEATIRPLGARPKVKTAEQYSQENSRAENTKEHNVDFIDNTKIRAYARDEIDYDENPNETQHEQLVRECKNHFITQLLLKFDQEILEDSEIFEKAILEIEDEVRNDTDKEVESKDFEDSACNRSSMSIRLHRKFLNTGCVKEDKSITSRDKTSSKCSCSGLIQFNEKQIIEHKCKNIPFSKLKEFRNSCNSRLVEVISDKGNTIRREKFLMLSFEPITKEKAEKLLLSKEVKGLRFLDICDEEDYADSEDEDEIDSLSEEPITLESEVFETIQELEISSLTNRSRRSLAEAQRLFERSNDATSPNTLNRARELATEAKELSLAAIEINEAVKKSKQKRNLRKRIKDAVARSFELYNEECCMGIYNYSIEVNPKPIDTVAERQVRSLLEPLTFVTFGYTLMFGFLMFVSLFADIFTTAPTGSNILELTGCNNTIGIENLICNLLNNNPSNYTNPNAWLTSVLVFIMTVLYQLFN